MQVDRLGFDVISEGGEMQRLGTGTQAEIRKEAALWLIEMDLQPERWDRGKFVAWLKSSPRHMEEFLEQTALWHALHDIHPGTIELRGLLKGSGNIVSWPVSTPCRPHDTGVNRQRWRFAALAAAVIFASVTAGLWNLLFVNTKVVTTAIGEQRAVRLDDRSVVHLNTSSRVEVRYTESAREVRLIQGEALFTVERDVNRPFRVLADGILVEALGTQFNVYQRGSDTIVSVVEGRVALVGPTDNRPSEASAVSSLTGTPTGQETGEKMQSGVPSHIPFEGGRQAPAGAVAVVSAGEEAIVSVDGAIDQHTIENVSSATAWRQRQLFFNNTPLADVAAEVARYNTDPRIEFVGEALQARQLNGVFAADDPESLIQFFARDSELSVTRSGNSVVIRSR